MPIHRTIKNVVKNYTYAEVKVREATSNDPWGPSTTLMSEIADLTYNVMAFAEIMQMIWKRLNDHGKNWRHVYKSLVLLDYLLKTGHERVAQQCRENLLTIQTLKDFQYIEDGKDHGQNVREKSKALVMLLKDDERFKNERTKALAAKERFAQNTGAAPGKLPHSSSDRYLYGSSTQGSSPPLNSELEAVRPSSYGEEDLQLQLALAMSKEEHDEEVKRRKGDELKLQMALEESRKISQQAESTVKTPGDRLLEFDASGGNSSSHIPLSATWDGQLSHASGAGPATSSNDPWSPTPAPINAGVTLDPWGMPVAQSTVSSNPMAGFNDPWAASVGPPANSFEPVPSAVAPQSAATGLSPWDPIPANPAPNGAHSFPSTTSVPPAVDDEFDLLSSRSKSPPSVSGGSAFDLVGASGSSGSAAVRAWDMTDLTVTLGDNKTSAGSADGAPKKKTAAEFLGQNANLVNLNDLISRPPPSTVINPFAMTTTTRTQSPAANLFATRAQQEEQSRRVPINQMPTSSGFSAATSFQQPGLSATPVVPGTAWQSPAMAPSMVGAGMYVQPVVGQPIMQPTVGLQPYPQSQNPFL